MKTALVIEDDEGIRSNVVDLLNEEGFASIGAGDGRAGLDLARSARPSLIVCDVRMPEMDGHAVLREVRADPTLRATPFVFLSAAADRVDVRNGMNLGADDYVTKPFTRMELLESVRTRLARHSMLSKIERAPIVAGAAQASATAMAPIDGDRVVLHDPHMRAIYEQASRVAVSPLSVLILGETGSGKEVLAQSIHKASSRSKQPIVALNCSALTETLLEAELFGHERGAFTGAVSARPGLFECAQGGTVFLDEIGEMPMVIQVKLLRVLEERRVLRVGGRTPIDIDVRFVSATHRDLEAAIERGSFRADLYYRLAGLTVTLPPLRDRPSEILPLALLFARNAAHRLDRQEAPELSHAAREVLLSHAWPGNVRELRNVIERAVVLAPTRMIDTPHLPPKLLAEDRQRRTPLLEPPPESAPLSSLRGEMDSLMRSRIVQALDRCAGNQTAAADLLGMSRRTLVARLSQYELPRPRKRL